MTTPRQAGGWRRRTVRVAGGIATAAAVVTAVFAVLVPPPSRAEGQPLPAAGGVGAPNASARDGPLEPRALAAAPPPPSGPQPASVAGAVPLAGDPCRSRAGPARRIALNSASRAELEELPGIGPAKAQRIVDWRTRHGRFRRIVDLRRVTGFGKKTVLRLAPYLVLDQPAPAAPAPATVDAPPQPSAPAGSPPKPEGSPPKPAWSPPKPAWLRPAAGAATGAGAAAATR